MLRCLKNINGTIIGIDIDRGQSGDDSFSGGEWCAWTIAEDAFPEVALIEGYAKALYFKENAEQNGLELRTQEEIELSPNE